MLDSPRVFSACEQDRFAIEGGGGGVEDSVDRIRPIVRGQDRVVSVAAEELALVHASAASRAGSRTEAATPAASSRSAARWKARVDSAPSFVFSSSVPSPSLQPPVAKS